MTSTIYFAFFVAPLLLCSLADDVDPNTLRAVFGYSALDQAALVGAESNKQAATVTPDNGTLVDPDYWDTEEFQPSTADYDIFDWVLTKRVASTSNANFLLSPLGLKLALAILTEAATGSTRSELASALGFGLDRTEVRRKFSTIIESLKRESPDYILNLGSRIYMGEGVQPRQRFAAIAQEFYKTELKTTNFFKPEVAAREINNWVSNATQGKIPNLVEADDVADVILLILNTLYFKGTWRHQFAPNATKPGPFYVSPQLQKTVPFMNVKDNFYYVDSSRFDAKILRLPYRGNKYAMYIVVPNSLTGLPRVLNNLSELRTEMIYLQERLVDVILPKFQFEYMSRLEGVLREMGVREAFEDTASFPGIARGQLLYQRLRVSKVFQRTGIEVNELGSVAFSATQIGIQNKFGEDSDINYEVVANKPFMFFIQEESTRQTLFTGRVSDPALVDGAFKA
uniref:Serpin 3a n=3 Tax=Manduca sexta TaxID=7130 RepID=Q867T1_MANSE|nr:serpin 3a [Manduca sexta]AAO21506.1 serpin 3b [Manduca sexta]